ncbi:MAG: hypothetical protein GQ468_02840 [Candidatus Scalindua sp.]|nr:hypothetical protein [Candidatus Scalindua sp.]
MPEQDRWEADIDWILKQSNCDLDTADSFADAVAARMGEDKTLSAQAARQLVRHKMKL